jgi:elongation factor G
MTHKTVAHGNGGAAAVAILGNAGSGRRTVAAALTDATTGIVFEIGLPEASDSSTPPDAVLLIASAAQGLDDTAVDAWERAAEMAIPRILVITHLDVGRVDDDEMRLIAQRILGEEIVPLVLPLADDDEELGGTLTLTTMLIRDEVSGLLREADSEHRDIAGPTRDRLVETVAANTEDLGLVQQFMLGLEPSPERLDAEVHALAAAGAIALAMPVAAAPTEGRPAVGVRELADVLMRIMKLR